MKSGITSDYVRKRITDHLARFNYLHDSIRKNNINERSCFPWIAMDNIFQAISFRDYNPSAKPSTVA